MIRKVTKPDNMNRRGWLILSHKWILTEASTLRLFSNASFDLYQSSGSPSNGTLPPQHVRVAPWIKINKKKFVFTRGYEVGCLWNWTLTATSAMALTYYILSYDSLSPRAAAVRSGGGDLRRSCNLYTAPQASHKHLNISHSYFFFTLFRLRFQSSICVLFLDVIWIRKKNHTWVSQGISRRSWQPGGAREAHTMSVTPCVEADHYAEWGCSLWKTYYNKIIIAYLFQF